MRRRDLLVCAFVVAGTQVVAMRPSISQSLSFYGQLLEPDGGSGISGAKAWLYPADDGAQGQQWYGPVISDSGGRFSFFDVPSGRYLLRIYVGVSPDSGRPMFQQEVDVPGKIIVHARD
jgi:hypothetical protein